MDGEWLLNGEMDMETDLVSAVHHCRSRGFLNGGQTSGDQNWASDKLVLEKQNPFGNLEVSDTESLNCKTERESCRLCNKSRKFFCYSCLVPLPSIESIIPKVELPIRIDIVKHRGEVEGKSTAVHAAILAPDSVNLYSFPDIPDCTWNQAHGICQDSRLNQLPCVIIESRKTSFWRNQRGKPKEYLATIEAIYYFCVDFHKEVLGRSYAGEYDNLLFFYKFMYQKIHQLYT